MTNKEIKDTLISKYSDQLNEDIINENDKFTTEEFGVIKYFDEDGVRADGQEIGIIFTVQDQLWRVPQYYSSWDSSECDLDDMYPVVKSQKTIDVYLPIKDAFAA